ncbi:MAG: hypothetical protein OEM28_03100 [Nitrosopumilus sp.]|nr:hypothetical protein [Nitrosopumilus sp.]MDH3488039.1 hypothetical protein [Nitrosopumilus sp.]
MNGTIVETANYEFKHIGHKVDAAAVLKIEMISLNANVDVEGFIQAIEVPDTENPTTYTGS